jgi:hypothetical protein
MSTKLVRKQREDRSNELKVEKGVPIPEYRPRVYGALADACKKMDIGDSVYVPGVKCTNSIMSSVSRILGAGRFTSRTVEGGVRVWRTK